MLDLRGMNPLKEYLFSYLAALDLSCSTRDLWSPLKCAGSFSFSIQTLPCGM